jgi:RNA polymerase sigma-70 factor, ECF subfamily
VILTTHKYSEDKLVKGILNKDHNAFNYLYDNYSSALLKSISYTITEKHTAEDILQNVFIKIYTRISLYDSSKGGLFTWMVNIARNEICDVLRQKGHKVRSKMVEWDSVPEPEPENPYENIDAADLRKMVFELSPELRNLIELNYFYGYTHVEIADLLTMPLGTVKTKIRRAYNLIRTLVAN